MNKSLVVGGSNGIGLSIALHLAKMCNEVIIVDRLQPDVSIPANISYLCVNLINNDFSFLTDYDDVDVLVITAGFGRVSRFEQILPQEIDNSFLVNATAVMHLLHYYYPRMLQKAPFYCAVMGSIAGLVVSPLFAIYGATKAAICNGIESLNIELEQAGTINRILNVSPGSSEGTKFRGGITIYQ